MDVISRGLTIQLYTRIYIYIHTHTYIHTYLYVFSPKCIMTAGTCSGINGFFFIAYTYIKKRSLRRKQISAVVRSWERIQSRGTARQPYPQKTQQNDKTTASAVSMIQRKLIWETLVIIARLLGNVENQLLHACLTSWSF
jgi:hypothetical protein